MLSKISLCCLWSPNIPLSYPKRFPEVNKVKICFHFNLPHYIVSLSLHSQQSLSSAKKQVVIFCEHCQYNVYIFIKTMISFAQVYHYIVVHSFKEYILSHREQEFTVKATGKLGNILNFKSLICSIKDRFKVRF